MVRITGKINSLDLAIAHKTRHSAIKMDGLFTYLAGAEHSANPHNIGTTNYDTWNTGYLKGYALQNKFGKL